MSVGCFILGIDFQAPDYSMGEQEALGKGEEGISLNPHFENCSYHAESVDKVM